MKNPIRESRLLTFLDVCYPCGFCSVAQAAYLLNISDTRIKFLINQKRLQTVPINGGRLILVASILRYAGPFLKQELLSP